MLRVWIAEAQLWCSLEIGMYRERSKVDERQAWGVILADAARHIAEALRKGYGDEPAEALRAIREVFNSELDEPTSGTSGSFV